MKESDVTDMTELPETRTFRMSDHGPIELGGTLAEARADDLEARGFPVAAGISREAELTEASQVKVAKALDSAADSLELALGYLETQGCLDSAQRVRRVREELHLARLVDDRLKAPR
jgi:hypothetical protein